jgi:hypothetical protein
MCDKVLARAFVAELIGPDYLLQLLDVAGTASGISWDELPREFAGKVNHACGGVIVVSERADPTIRLPEASHVQGFSRYHVHPDTFDLSAAIALFDYWQTLGYGWTPGNYREWGYKDIKRMVLVESLADTSGGQPVEVKVFCFNGRPGSIVVVEVGRDLEMERHRRYLEDEFHKARVGLHIDERVWTSLLQACRSLSAHTDMVRVDWFMTSDGPRFNELTSYPGGGGGRLLGHRSFSSDELELILAQSWSVPKEYV